MNEYILTDAARAELDDLIEFIRHDSPEMALHVLGAIERAMELIAGNPGIGHTRDDLADETLKVWLVYSYMVVYRPSRPLEIVHILHGARDFSGIVGQQPPQGPRARKRRKR